MSRYCTNCGTGASSSATFCTGCGQKIGRYCTNCGARILEGAAFCVGCGSPLAPGRMPQQAQQAQNPATQALVPAFVSPATAQEESIRRGGETVPDPVPHRPFPVGEILGVLMLAVVISVATLALAWPWLPPLSQLTPWGNMLDRYAPSRHGEAMLFENYDAEGSLTSWNSYTRRLVPGESLYGAFNDVPGLIAAVEQAHRDSGDPRQLGEWLGDVQFAERFTYRLASDGGVLETYDLLMREPRGQFLIASDSRGSLEVLNPPALLVPADVSPESEPWVREGTYGTTGETYRTGGRVLGSYTFESEELGRFDDCLKLENHTTFHRDDEITEDTTQNSLYCAGVGGVQSEFYDANGALMEWEEAVATDLTQPAGQPIDSSMPIVPTLTTDNVTSGDPAGWSLTRLAGSQYPQGGTIPPTYIPTDPPLILAADRQEKLIAYNAGGDPGAVEWHFRPEGTIYGEPAFDPEYGRIYFGATDKKLYALDARGLFLWAFETGDNIATRPLVAQGAVVFGSEDHNVYAVDGGTGELLWKKKTGGPVVSSPALVEDVTLGSEEKDVVVIGSDDKFVYGFDLETGEQLWRHETHGPVEAPVISDGGMAYVASRDGTVSALDPATGKALWAPDVNEVLRTAPAVSDNAVFVVDEAGKAHAVDREDGKLRRNLITPPENTYFAGPPLVSGETLLLANTRDNVYSFGFDGEEQGRWSVAEAGGFADPSLPFLPYTFSLGPTSGGGAVWLADNNNVVYRLGPAGGPGGFASLPLEWVTRYDEVPLNGVNTLYYTAADYRGKALVLDYGNNVYLIDPATGEGRPAGPAAPESANIVTEPVVAGDTLLVVDQPPDTPDTLYATSLPDGDRLWQFEGVYASGQPPVVAGDTVLWFTRNQGGTSGTLHALDLSTGEVRWETEVEEPSNAGGIIVEGDTVYTSTPPAAFDLNTGERRWQAGVEDLPLGGPALSESGDVLFVGLVSEDGEKGAVTALDATDGRELWRADLEDENQLRSSERLWVSGDTVVVPSYFSNVIALDAESGEESWEYVPRNPRFGSVTVEEERVWLSIYNAPLHNARVLGLDLEDGEIVAQYSNRYPDRDDDTTFNQRPMMVGGRLIFPMGNQLLGFEPPGEEVAAP